MIVVTAAARLRLLSIVTAARLRLTLRLLLGSFTISIPTTARLFIPKPKRLVVTA